MSETRRVEIPTLEAINAEIAELSDHLKVLRQLRKSIKKIDASFPLFRNPGAEPATTEEITG